MTTHIISLPQKKVFAIRLTPETIHVLVLISVAASIVLPMIFWGMPSANDLSNHFRFALPFYDGLKSGHLYPGWSAESNYGFGDPSFRFYPPGLYYLLALTRALAGNWYTASVLTFAMISVFGALGMYLWAREFTCSQNAMWAGIFYSVAPYRLNQLFQGLLLAEFAGAAILPFAFLFTERVCRQRRPRDVAGLAVFYALLVLTHLPLAVMGSIAIAFYALLRIDKKAWRRSIAALGVSAFLGLAASACYWLTMIIELKWIHGNDFDPEPGISYRDNFVLSTFSPDFLGVWWMNILLLFMAAMFWPALVLAIRTAREKIATAHGNIVLALTALFSIALFLATPLSRPIWNAFRPLQQTQFPWRWLAVVSLAGSMLLALAIPFWIRLMQTRRRPLVIFALGTVAISLAFSVSHIIREARWLSPTEFEQTVGNLRDSQSIKFWLPAWAHESLPKANALVEAGNRSIKIDRWAPEDRVFEVSAGEPIEARIRTFFYPHWTAISDGHLLSTRPDKDGILLVSLPQDAASVHLVFREPPRTRVAGITSVAGCVLIGILASPFSRRRRK